jgi:hypothetical protein
MALGGGTWLFQNKVMPGAYINFASKVRASVSITERGYGAMGLILDWGPVGEVFTVEVEDFQSDSLKFFGYDYTADEITGLRDLFKNLQTGYFYRLNNEPAQASCSLGTAKYGGIRGNDLTITVQANVDDEDMFDVITYLAVGDSRTVVDKQTVSSKSDLEDNDYIVFNRDDAELEISAGLVLAGGTNGENITGVQYQEFLDKIEPYYFNTLGLVSTDSKIQDLYIQFTKRMRDDVGMKFQTVIYGKEKVDYEGVISIMNKVTDEGESPASLVYWLTGAEASCAVNASCTNKTYDGDFTVDVNYKQSALEKAINSGMLAFHRVTDPTVGDISGDINVLTDINTFTSFSKAKNKDFAKNQVMRVLDQIAIDLARLFNRQYLGKEPNDSDGRIALWNDIVAYYQELQRVRAIQNFVSDDVPVPLQGEDKDTVLSEYAIQPTCCMEKLYMKVLVA